MRQLSIVLGILFLCAGSIAAQEEKKQAQPSAQEQAAMQAWMKYMTPGDAHKLLDLMTGTFDAKVTMWMAPGAQPSVSTGVSNNSLVLGGRFLEERFEGSFMGQPFSGIGYTGYDNAKKQYWSTWIDNMSTGVMTSRGNTSDAGKNWRFTSMTTDPATGKDVPGDTTVTIPDRDHHTMEMWGPGPDGKNFKMMEIVYTRRK